MTSSKEDSAACADGGKKRTHKCHKCPKEYNKTSHLRAHLRAHDNYRPYVCDLKSCGKSFTRSDELKRHKRIHADDRNFLCPVCKKKFLRSDHLSKHLLVHNKGHAGHAAKKSKKQYLSASVNALSVNGTLPATHVADTSQATDQSSNANDSSTTLSLSKLVDEMSGAIARSSNNNNTQSATTSTTATPSATIAAIIQQKS